MIPSLFRRYLSVWLWAILVGAATGILYSYVSVRDLGNWHSLALGLILVAALGGISAFVALLLLYRYLRSFIIPTFLAQTTEDTDSSDKPPTALEKIEADRIHNLLSKAFLLLVFSAGMLLFLYFVEAFLSILQRL